MEFDFKMGCLVFLVLDVFVLFWLLVGELVVCVDFEGWCVWGYV